MCAFGAFEDRHHARFPAARFVEARPCLDIFALTREGALVPGREVTLEWGTVGFRLAAAETGICVDGQHIATVAHSHLPLRMFVCPACNKTCYRVYEFGGRWGCRKCHRLDYGLSRHLRRGAKSGVGRVERLRARLGDCETRCFAPLPPRRRRRRRKYYERLITAILDEEAKLIGHLGGVVRDLQRRPR